MVTSLRRRSQPAADSVVRVASRRWRPRIDVKGVVAILLGVLIFVNFDARNGVDVLVATKTVQAGHVLDWSDLTTARISVGHDLHVIPSSDEESIIGRVTSVGLALGAPLVRADLGTDPPVPNGQAKVAIPIKVSNLLPNLAAGDHVIVTETGSSTNVTQQTTASGTAAVSVTAVVLGVQMPSTDFGENTATVSVLIPRSANADVSAWAAAGTAWISVVSADEP